MTKASKLRQKFSAPKEKPGSTPAAWSDAVQGTRERRFAFHRVGEEIRAIAYALLDLARNGAESGEQQLKSARAPTPIAGEPCNQYTASLDKICRQPFTRPT
jgi:hypothetical protein